MNCLMNCFILGVLSCLLLVVTIRAKECESGDDCGPKECCRCPLKRRGRRGLGPQDRPCECEHLGKPGDKCIVEHMGADLDTHEMFCPCRNNFTCKGSGLSEQPLGEHGVCGPPKEKENPDKLDCTKVLCMACKDDEKSFVPKGQCCPRCRPMKKAKKEKANKKKENKKKGKPDCSTVRCMSPGCDKNEEPYTPKNKCCPTKCKPKRPDYLPPKRCPDEVRTCVADPCGDTKPECPACPKATCVSDYCPNCWPALFKYKKRYVDCGRVECDDQQKCSVDPCSLVTPPKGGVCVSNYCGGCNAVCYTKTCKRVKRCKPIKKSDDDDDDDEESGSGSGCVIPSPKVCDDPQPCLIDPCSLVTPPKGGACVSNYCGGCNAVCYNKSCKRVKKCKPIKEASSSEEERSGSGAGAGD